MKTLPEIHRSEPKNFWINLHVDGYKRHFRGGPRGVTGGFTLEVFQRDANDLVVPVTMKGYYNEPDNTVRLTLTYSDGEDFFILPMRKTQGGQKDTDE